MPQTQTLTRFTFTILSALYLLFYHSLMCSFSEELPSRCKKQIVNAAAASDTNGRITSEGMWTIVNNIGAGNFISKHDIESIFDEVAVYDGNVEGFTRGEAATIDVDAMLRIL